ncbi:hypothetical protein [Sphingobium yanoikuyae]|uniref:hypothetical protein n=1 Tax=Sphingobium yanoikuyae TaxID=13690 RepID=UPI0022DDBF83|nr:hypothetical protein [Sphingobium yanoikuyae]WBQ17640.1 hypothetical protein PAE53_05380 [Sphingobium yanoikuyae]
MMPRRGMLGVLAGGAGALLLLGGYNYFVPARYRVRMTVEVVTPQGVRTGSSVYEESAYKAVHLTPHEHSGGGGLRGEAVVVDLPGGPLFVLLTSASASGQPLGVLMTRALSNKPNFKDVDAYVSAVRWLSWFGGKAELPRTDWPLMVRFQNFDDPRSVEYAEPEAIGVRRIMLEVTSVGITTGIEKHFPPWFEVLARRRARFDGDNSIAVKSNPDTVAGTFGPGDFTTVYNPEH